MSELAGKKVIKSLRSLGYKDDEIKSFLDQKYHHLVNDDEWYCTNCGKYYGVWQKSCERCLEENTIKEGDW